MVDIYSGIYAITFFFLSFEILRHLTTKMNLGSHYEIGNTPFRHDKHVKILTITSIFAKNMEKLYGSSRIHTAINYSRILDENCKPYFQVKKLHTHSQIIKKRTQMAFMRKSTHKVHMRKPSGLQKTGRTDLLAMP